MGRPADPEGLRPYFRLARIERPIGWWLLLLPCWWSAGLAAVTAGRELPNLSHCVLFLIGAIAMRGAGSTYNDIVDRDLDARVERTRDRPLPSGQVSLAAAVGFLILQCLVGLGVLLQFNRFAIATGFASIAIVAFYPFMKRVFWIPQIVLGLAFAWGALMGWAAAFGSLGSTGAALWRRHRLGGRLRHIYALQDIETTKSPGSSPRPGSSARGSGSESGSATAWP